jgi:hypothetical protein
MKITRHSAQIAELFNLYLRDAPFDELVISQRIVNGGGVVFPTTTNGGAKLGCALPAVGCALPSVAGLILQSALVTA